MSLDHSTVESRRYGQRDDLREINVLGGDDRFVVTTQACLADEFNYRFTSLLTLFKVLGYRITITQCYEGYPSYHLGMGRQGTIRIDHPPDQLRINVYDGINDEIVCLIQLKVEPMNRRLRRVDVGSNIARYTRYRVFKVPDEAAGLFDLLDGIVRDLR